MKVLHVDSGREMRGGQWQALYLAVGQKTLGQEALLMAREGSMLWTEAVKRNVPCRPLSYWGLWRESAAVDLVHVHDARSHTMAAIASRKPVVVSRRVGFPVRTSSLSRWKYRRAVRYLAISEFVAARLTDAGVDPKRIAVVYDGVPLEPRRALGAEFIAPAWDDPRKESALAREAARQAGVNLVESHDLKEDLVRARALVYLSDMEGLGSAALLAMGAGIPVIASRVGGLPEIVHDHLTGLLVNNDAASVKGAIVRLRDDQALAERLGTRAREMVKDGFTLAHMALRSLGEYKKALG